ncbi:hypothetical protein E0Z10_g6573 [Xylaria hypoxylon]|uniref:Uncharacterized protein n=1 Tax=Xylaria hypoxylon TaxID=37992 RepID=A0A4Z0YSX1_9PEZI|nr:hypothetical protein E0Z10_g6573 [Xylaria hypoxylon]
MANNTTIKGDNESSPSKCFSGTSDIHPSIGTNFDPIVLDDDSSDDTAQKKGNMARKKRQSPRHKRRRIPSGADDTNRAFTPARRFTDIIQPEPAHEEVTRLNDKMASLQAENLKLESARSESTRITNKMADEIATLNTTLVTMKTLVEEHEVLKLRFEESETKVSKLREELEHSRGQNVEATETRESVQRELMAQRQLGQAQETELAETKNALRDSRKYLQTAQNQAALATQHLKKAREERFETTLEVSTLLVDRSKLFNELAKVRQDCAIIPTLRFNLMATDIDLAATFEAFSQAQARGFELESRLQELETEKATLESRIVELETQQKEHERATGKLRYQLTEIECDKSTLEEENIKLVASNAEVEKKTKVLQSSINGMTKAYEAMKLQRDKLQHEMKEFTNEREQLYRRLKGLEEKCLELAGAVNTQTAELAVAKQDVSRLATARSDLEAAQQQVKEMEDHMARCPMAKHPKEFRDEFYRRLDRLDEDIEWVNNDLAANPLL